MAKAKVKKNAKGYGYNYADLSEVTNHIGSINGSYYQYTKTDPTDGKSYIWTHRSADDQIHDDIDVRGAEIVAATLSNGKQNPAQAAGSAMTYARRYSLYMAYGLACVDDDAESLTIPPDSIDSINRDFTTASTAKNRASTSTARKQILKYCSEHGLDIYTICEQYGIEKGMAESVLAAKLDMIKKDHGE